MGTFVVKGRPTFLGEQNLGDYAHAIATDYGAEEQDETVLTDSTRKLKGGLFTFGFSMDCYYDAAVEELTIADVGQGVPLSFATVDGTVGEVAYLINCREFISSPLNASVGDMAGLNISGNAADKLIRGYVAANRISSPVTASANSLDAQIGAVSADQRVYAAIHILSASGSSPTIQPVIQSDDNGSFTSATNRITFSEFGVAGSQFKSVAGAITDDYWRCHLLVGGGSPSFTCAVTVGIL